MRAFVWGSGLRKIDDIICIYIYIYYTENRERFMITYTW